MADTKITALTQITTPVEADVLPIVINISTTPLTDKVLVNDLLNAKTLYSVVPAGDFTLTASATAQAAFPITGDTFTVVALKTYLIEGQYYITKSGLTSTTAILFAGTATFTSLAMTVLSANVTAANTTTATSSVTLVNQVASTVVNASATTPVLIQFRGLIRVSAAGTIIPQIQFSAAITTPVMTAGSYMRLTAQETSTTNTLGAVA